MTEQSLKFCTRNWRLQLNKLSVDKIVYSASEKSHEGISSMVESVDHRDKTSFAVSVQ